MSYNGSVQIGLMGDYDALADLEQIASMIEAEIATLLELAGGTGAPAAAGGGARGVGAGARAG